MATDREIWESDEWVRRREEYRGYRRRYDGRNLEARDEARDPRTGRQVKRFPLHLNADKLVCDIHKDIARGMPTSDDPLFVRTSVRHPDNTELAKKAERLINDRVWRPSRGGAIQQEGLLSMNIYGGTAYKLSWEPWDPDLPLGVSVRLVKDPSYISPTWDYLNPWRMIECYFGYEITPEIAEKKYGVKPKSDVGPSLYMEYWTPKEWRIMVDDQVPVMRVGDTDMRLAGENPWNFVPIYYAPHERTTELFGDSEIEFSEGLVEEINSRSTTISDLVRAVKAQVYVGTNIVGNPVVKVVQFEGKPLFFWVDIGRAQGIQGSRPPALTSLSIPDVPEGVMGWPKTLLEFWMMFERISPAAFGLDDTRSGRITGPAVSQRMWTSTAHAVTERINYTTMKNILDSDVLKIVSSDQVMEALGSAGKSLPAEGVSDPDLEIHQVWPPMMPLDQQEHHKQLTERYREMAIAPESYFREYGVEDVEGEMDGIEDWFTRLSILQSLRQPPMFGGGNERGSSNQNQGVQQRGGEAPSR